MNERYLFRGKRTDTGKWEIGLLARYNEKYPCANIIDEMELLIPVETKTVGQCTGLKDKNGKLIFEGDIVKGLFNFGLEIMSVCTFKDGAFGLTAKQCGAYHFSAFTSLWEVKYEVAGNIHDNPELLESDT